MAMDEASQQANRAGIDPKRLVVIFYAISALVLALFLEHVLGMIWAGLGWSDPEVIEGVGWKVSTVLGFILSAGISLGCYLRFNTLSMEVATELMKVTWPSWEETRVSTIAVVVASVVAALLLFGIDTISYKLMVEWLPALWGKL